METQPAFFSVIVPTRNRAARLAHCLTILAHLDYPRDRFEVIVVDDGSEISPEDVVNAFREWVDVKLITQSHAGPATARNTGAAQARGTFLAFTDDDCAPASDWLQSLSDRFTHTPDCVIGGRVVNGLSENLYSTASQLLIDYLYAYFNAASGALSFFTSNNLAIATEQFRKVGGFDGSFPGAAAEDRELADRCRHYGIRMIYAPEAVVYHMHALTLRSFWRQHFAYGRGASHFHDVRAQRKPDGVKLEPLKFYLNLLRYPLTQSESRRPLLLVALLVISQAANASGFFAEELSKVRKIMISAIAISAKRLPPN